jgi:hypothetical protein
MISRNVMAGAMAFIVSFGALGSFVGSWIVGYLNGLTGAWCFLYLHGEFACPRRLTDFNDRFYQ